MLDAVKGVLDRVLVTRCQYCERPVGGGHVRMPVKVPGYTGRHREAFCDEDHHLAWREHVQDWEERNYEIPTSNVGPACGGC